MERNPFRSLERQFENLQRQFAAMGDVWDGEQLDVPKTGIATSRLDVDIADRGDEFVVSADLPGLESDDIDLRLSGDTVHSTAEHERAEHDADEHYLQSERARRAMHRSVRLSEPVDEDAVEATCENGVLTVTLPKAEPTALEGTKIDVQTRGST